MRDYRATKVQILVGDTKVSYKKTVSYIPEVLSSLFVLAAFVVLPIFFG